MPAIATASKPIVMTLKPCSLRALRPMPRSPRLKCRTTRAIHLSTEVMTFDSARLSGIPLAHTLPPHHAARIGFLRTFALPIEVTGSAADRDLGRRLINAWRNDGILQVAVPNTYEPANNVFGHSKSFFTESHDFKAKHVDPQSFSGYVASGEEITAGIADYSEIFTVTKDLPTSDRRVQQKWPCHGPCPWPNEHYKNAMKALMGQMGDYGEKLLKLTALGLGLKDENELNRLTGDGWHHMRILRFPQVNRTNGKGKTGRGIGSHTDYGLLVIAAQDQVGGLFIRPPMADETTSNWETSSAGLNEDDDKWVYVPPVANTFTVFPGDMLQYLTNSYLQSTPHKVGLNTTERYAFAYFHEPNFQSVVRPLKEFDDNGSNGTKREGIHYGTHFTNMAMRNYPGRVTAKRMEADNGWETLKGLEDEAKRV